MDKETKAVLDEFKQAADNLAKHFSKKYGIDEYTFTPWRGSWAYKENMNSIPPEPKPIKSKAHWGDWQTGKNTLLFFHHLPIYPGKGCISIEDIIFCLQFDISLEEYQKYSEKCYEDSIYGQQEPPRFIDWIILNHRGKVQARVGELRRKHELLWCQSFSSDLQDMVKARKDDLLKTVIKMGFQIFEESKTQNVENK